MQAKNASKGVLGIPGHGALNPSEVATVDPSNPIVGAWLKRRILIEVEPEPVRKPRKVPRTWGDTEVTPEPSALEPHAPYLESSADPQA